MGAIDGAITGVQGILLLVLAVASLGVKVWAFSDALRHRPDAYVAADKRTKNFWLLVTGIALAVGVVLLYNPLSFLNLIAVIASAVYLADVRPALRHSTGRGGSGGGPYGGW